MVTPRIVGCSLLAVLVVTLISPKVWAASGGITINPSIIQTTALPSQKALTLPISITNNAASPVSITTDIRPFTTLNDQGGIQLLSTTDTVAQHSLIGYLALSQSSFAIPPGSSQTIQATITHIDQLAPGGYYIAVVFTVTPLRSLAGNYVSINSAASTLVFFSTASPGTQNLSIVAPKINTISLDMPTSADIVLSDTGNTQTTPSGYVQLLNGQNTVIKQGVFNTESSMLLPGATRLYSTPMKTVASVPWWPGLYRLTVYYRHPGQQNYSVLTYRYFYISKPLVSVLLLCVSVIAVLIIRKTGRQYRYRLAKRNSIQ